MDETSRSRRRANHEWPRGDSSQFDASTAAEVAGALAGAVVVSTVALALVVLPLLSWLDALVLVVVCGLVGFWRGREAGFLGALAAFFWFAWAITEPSFRASIDDPVEVRLTVGVVLLSVVAVVLGDLVRSRTGKDG